MLKTNPIDIHPCQCGSRALVQDFGSVVFVKCRGCGEKSGQHNNSQSAVEEWNYDHPKGKPTQIECKGAELFDWTSKEKLGDILIHGMQTKENGLYILHISWKR